jgi:hypothetical protein
MARYSTGCLTTAGSTTLPIASLYAGANAGGTLREIGLSNTTSTAISLKLIRLTTTGTQGAGLTEARQNPNAPATANCAAFNTHSGAPTLGDDLGYRIRLGAADGASLIWTFGSDGVVIPVGTSNGVGILVESGTGQPVLLDIVWDE